MLDTLHFNISECSIFRRYTHFRQVFSLNDILTVFSHWSHRLQGHDDLAVKKIKVMIFSTLVTDATC